MDLPKLFTPKTKTNLVYYVKASAPVSPGVFCCFAVLLLIQPLVTWPGKYLSRRHEAANDQNAGFCFADSAFSCYISILAGHKTG